MAAIGSLQSHPMNALEAKAFTAPTSLSFPGGAAHLNQDAAAPAGYQEQGQEGGAANGNVVTPATPAATPGGATGVSGIVPTLQYVF